MVVVDIACWNSSGSCSASTADAAVMGAEAEAVAASSGCLGLSIVRAFLVLVESALDISTLLLVFEP